MSDGPHRSLPRRENWKKASLRADKAAFAPEEIARAIEPALAADWKKDVPPDLISALDRCFGGESQMSLLSASPEALTALRPIVVGSPLGGLILDCADQVAAEGLKGVDAMERIVADALLEWGRRGVRQVEEHYLRETSDHRAINVRTRLETGLFQVPFFEMAQQILGKGRPPIVHRPIKAMGLDDGVYF